MKIFYIIMFLSLCTIALLLAVISFLFLKSPVIFWAIFIVLSVISTDFTVCLKTDFENFQKKYLK